MAGMPGGAKPVMLGNGYCMAPAKVMLPGFQTAQEATNCLVYLFKDVIIDSDTKYAWAVFGCFLLAFSAEATRFLRARLKERRPTRGVARLPHASHVAIEALAFALQMTLAYWLMLIVMTYEWVFMLCIVLGLSIGWFANEMLLAPTTTHEAAKSLASGDACCELGDGHVK